jgi:hypothetical protein
MDGFQVTIERSVNRKVLGLYPNSTSGPLLQAVPKDRLYSRTIE